MKVMDWATSKHGTYMMMIGGGMTFALLAKYFTKPKEVSTGSAGATTQTCWSCGGTGGITVGGVGVSCTRCEGTGRITVQGDIEGEDLWNGVSSIFDKIGEGLVEAAPMLGVVGMLAALQGNPNKALEWTGEGIAALGATCLLLDAAGGLPGIKAAGLI